MELLGGGVRVPAVQARLKELLGELELGVHLNGDEAMALGAAFRAANISTAFRVRKVAAPARPCPCPCRFCRPSLPLPPQPAYLPPACRACRLSERELMFTAIVGRSGSRM